MLLHPEQSSYSSLERIDVNIDPPPDLAIEIDNASDSQIKKNSYQVLGVPELWIYDETRNQRPAKPEAIDSTQVKFSLTCQLLK